MDGDGHRDAALDIIFDKIDDWLCEGKFDECDEFLGRLKVEIVPTLLLIGILTITYAAHDHLANRPRVFNRIRDIIFDRGQDADKLLGNRGTSLQ